MQKFYKHLFTESRKSSISTKNSKSIFEYSQTLSPLNTLNILKYTNTLFSIVMMSHHLKIKSVKCNKVSSHTFKCVILNIKCRSSKAVLKCQMQKKTFSFSSCKKRSIFSQLHEIKNHVAFLEQTPFTHSSQHLFNIQNKS